MALLFMDGFDLYGSAGDVTKRGWIGSTWNGVNQSPRVPGSSGKSANTIFNTPAHAMTIPGTPPSTVIVGMGWFPSSSGIYFQLKDTATNSNAVQVNVFSDSSGFLGVNRTSTASVTTSLFTSPTPVARPGIWCYVELKAVAHASAGTIEVRVNGATVCALTGQNTASSGAARFGQLYLGSGANSVTSFFDDLYICDNSGARLNDFLGECRIDPQMPSSDVSISGWTRSAGTSDFSAVNKAVLATTPNLTAAAAGALDAFGLAALTGTPSTIHAVQATYAHLKSDAGAATMRANVKSGATTQNGATISPGTTSAYQTDIVALDPATGAAWTAAGLNAANLQLERVT